MDVEKKLSREKGIEADSEEDAEKILAAVTFNEDLANEDLEDVVALVEVVEAVGETAGKEIANMFKESENMEADTLNAISKNKETLIEKKDDFIKYNNNFK